jgi:hypothetical protein
MQLTDGNNTVANHLMEITNKPEIVETEFKTT